MKLTTVVLSAILGLITFSSSADDAPLTLTKEISGSAKVLTSASILVDGQVVALAHIRDLDEMPAFCHWRYGTHKTGAYPLAASADTPENRAVCAKNPNGSWRAPGEHKYRCEVAFTAKEQAEKLRDIVEGNVVTCRVPKTADMKEYWDAGRVVSRYGHRLLPGVCVVAGKSVGFKLLQTGYATASKNPYITPFGGSAQYWPDVVDESYRKIERFRLEQQSLLKQRKATLPSTLSACTTDAYAELHPEWYNPKPNLE